MGREWTRQAARDRPSVDGGGDGDGGDEHGEELEVGY